MSELLFHYTKLDTLFNIVKDKVRFRASKYDEMNDPGEYSFADNNIKKMYSEEKLKKLAYEKDEFIPFVISFSSSYDDPVIWRLYQAEVCLVLKKSELIKQERGYLGDSCHYTDEENFEKDFSELLEEQVNDFGNDEVVNIYSAAALIKHRDFLIENEYRLFIWNNQICKFANGVMENPDLDEDVKLRGLRGMKIGHYKECVFDKSVLAGIVIHETDDSRFKELSNEITGWLERFGYDINQVFICKTNNVSVNY